MILASCRIVFPLVRVIWLRLNLRQRITFSFLGVGFAGLGLTRLTAEIFFGGEKQFMQSRAGTIIVFTFTFIWFVGLLALLPMSVVIDQKRVPRSSMREYPWWQWALLVPYFNGDINARVPLWIVIPLFGIALLLAGFIALVLIMIGLNQIFHFN